MSLLDRINANPLPFAQLLGIEFIMVEEDALSARMTIRPELCTLGDIGHGGAIMSFADTLGAAAPEPAPMPAPASEPTAAAPSPAACSRTIAERQFRRRRAGRRDRHWPHLARSSRQENLDLADAGGDRGRQARRADGADPDDAVKRPCCLPAGTWPKRTNRG